MQTSSILLTRRVRVFSRFFDMGQEESVSPFLSEEGRRISKNLTFKSALLAAFLLFLAFLLRIFQVSLAVPFLLSIVYVLVGSPLLVATLDDFLRKRDVNIDTLMALAAFGALFLGFPMEGAFLLVLFELSQAMEDVLTFKAKKSLSELGELNPEQALCVEKDGSFREKSVLDVKPLEVVVVRAGEIVPLDGTVVSGQATCSLSHLTGEAIPVLFPCGATVPSGARVVEGCIHVEVKVPYEQSTIAKLIQLITRVHENKPTLSQVFEKYGRVYAISIISLSFVLALLPLVTSLSFLGEDGAFKRAMTFLITASPCALILAMPISYLSALGSTLRKGAVLKGSIVLDRLHTCSTVAFDKTGTLTYGGFELVSCSRLSGTLSEDRALQYLVSIEQYSTHPLAQALVAEGKNRSYTFLPCHDIRSEPGRGLQGIVEDGEKSVMVRAGSQAYMDLTNPPIEKGNLYFSAEGSLFACHFKDTPRKESKDVVNALRKMKKRVVLISGDRQERVEKFAHELGIFEVWSEATPEEKVSAVSSFAKSGLAMVGDGLNDAPALAQATVGISMGTLSSASAREVSDVILLHDNLMVVPWLFQKSLSTQRIVMQNLGLAVCAILGGVIPAFQGLLPLWGAVLLHEGSTLLVALNGLRLLK